MIIDKVRATATAEDLQKEDLILLQQVNFLKECEKNKTPEKWKDFFDMKQQELRDLWHSMEEKYIILFAGNKSAILSDVQEVLAAISKEDFEKKMQKRSKRVDQLNEYVVKKYDKETAKRIIDDKRKETIKSFENCCNFIEFVCLRVQYDAFLYYDFSCREIDKLVEQKAAEWYKKPRNFKFTPYYAKRYEENKQSKKVAENQIVKIPHTKQFRKLDKFDYLTDQISTGIFDGEINIETIMFSAFVDFENLDGVKLSKKLSSYEKFVWHTCVNLIFQDNHDILTLEQIYKAMGNSGNANPETKAEILEAIENMSKVRVTVDVPINSELYPELDQFKGTFQLLATNTKQALSRGQIAKNSIQILEKPQLFYFAKAINQVCSFPAAVLEVPVNKTKANITLLNFLLQKILKMKHDDFSQKEILLNEMFMQCNINDRSKKSRLLNKENGTLRKMLNHFVFADFIHGYEITERELNIVI